VNNNTISSTFSAIDSTVKNEQNQRILVKVSEPNYKAQGANEISIYNAISKFESSKTKYVSL
jgi:hypothetical protein